MFGLFRKSQDLGEVYTRNPILLDVRTRGEFSTGSVPNAINIPLNELNSRISELQKSNRPVIAFCRTGSRSGFAKSILASNNIEVYNGGSWNEVARKLMKAD